MAEKAVEPTIVLGLSPRAAELIWETIEEATSHEDADECIPEQDRNIFDSVVAEIDEQMRRHKLPKKAEGRS